MVFFHSVCFFCAWKIEGASIIFKVQHFFLRKADNSFNYAFIIGYKIWNNQFSKIFYIEAMVPFIEGFFFFFLDNFSWMAAHAHFSAFLLTILSYTLVIVWQLNHLSIFKIEYLVARHILGVRKMSSFFT